MRESEIVRRIRSAYRRIPYKPAKHLAGMHLTRVEIRTIFEPLERRRYQYWIGYHETWDSKYQYRRDSQQPARPPTTRYTLIGTDLGHAYELEFIIEPFLTMPQARKLPPQEYEEILRSTGPMRHRELPYLTAEMGVRIDRSMYVIPKYPGVRPPEGIVCWPNRHWECVPQTNLYDWRARARCHLKKSDRLPTPALDVIVTHAWIPPSEASTAIIREYKKVQRHNGTHEQ